VVVDNQSDEPFLEVLALCRRETVDFRAVVADGKHTLPAGDWVGADDWVDRKEFCADIFRGTTFLAVDLKSVLLGGIGEGRLSVCRIKTL
jgi:hypothetical protein